MLVFALVVAGFENDRAVEQVAIACGTIRRIPKLYLVSADMRELLPCGGVTHTPYFRINQPILCVFNKAIGIIHVRYRHFYGKTNNIVIFKIAGGIVPTNLVDIRQVSRVHLSVDNWHTISASIPKIYLV
jgi:hypothetical protein